MRTVGIYPRSEFECRKAFFAALSEAFPTVRIVPRGADSRAGLNALIEFGGDSEASAAAAEGIPAIAALGSESDADGAVDVALSDRAGLDPRLRGQTLPDRYLAELAPLTNTMGAEVLARANDQPLWLRRGQLDVVAVAPTELAEEEPLRARVGRDRSIALLPLLELLRALTESDRWRPPPARAAFLLDDPNLHWPSYGYLKLPELERHATTHGYHLALAMVPLDAWFAHPAAARLLRDGHSLSLLVHGNDHLANELGQASVDAEALALAAQAQRRITAFEQRAGVPVSRVMAPPHEACSEAVSRALVRAGFDAITMTRPYPWLASSSRSWLTAPAGAGRMAGWRPADLTPGHSPVLLRHPLSNQACSGAEMVLRAYLDQPLILYGHHDDLAEGLDVLAQRTAEVNRIGDPVRWASLGEIAATSFEHRIDGDLLRLRPYARRIAIEVPEGIDQVVVESPLAATPGEMVRTPGGVVQLGEPFSVAGPGPLELSLKATNAISPRAVPAPPRRPWPLARRIAAEARDRVAPAKRYASARR